MMEEIQISSSQQLNTIIDKLSAMQLRRELKLLAGSFQLNAIVYAQFSMRDSGQVWELKCVNDAHGGGYLKKL